MTSYPAILVFLALAPFLVFAGESGIPQKRGPDQVLLVVNENSPVSKAIAADYALKRRVRNTVSVRCPDSALNTGNETLSFADYSSSIEQPVRRFLSAHSGR